MINIHATLISYKNKRILLTGKSGSGKSDLALRMIINNKAKLVADDRVILENIGNKLIGYAPDNLFGLLEIRGVGIKECTALENSEICLCVELCDELHDIAYKNTREVYPPELRSMREVLRDFEKDVFLPENKEPSSEFYVLTNEMGQYGAVNILYPDITEKMRENVKKYNF